MCHFLVLKEKIHWKNSENQTLLLLNVGYTANNWGIYQSLTFVLISIQTNIQDGGWKSWCLFF